MFTTPRKVKQESRLRRSLSLTNTNANTTNSNSRNPNEEDGGCGGTEFEAHLTGTPCLLPTEGFISSQDPYYQQLSADFTFSNQPPPYRAPPSALGVGPELQTHFDADFINSPPGIENTPTPFQASPNPNPETYQTHSAKFPIVKEVIFSAQSGGRQLPPNLNGLSGSTSRLPSFPAGDSTRQKLAAKPSLGWGAEERKAFTLDSRTTKEFQERFQPGSQKTITRRNSLDLEKFIQVFNEEQALLASMQGRHLEQGGIDNPGLDLGTSHPNSNPHSSRSSATMYNGGKLAGYFPDSASNSGSASTSQSQSLSSSNTDSLDTVIYKGPSAQQGSIRDWQQRSGGDQNAELPMEFNHRSDAHRDVGNHIDPRAYQMQQHAYQQQHTPQYNGQNYTIDYRPTAQAPSQQQFQQQLHQQQQQGLSVQSLQQHSTHQNGGVGNHQNNGINNGLPLSGMGMMRGGNNGSVNPGYLGSNPQLSSKSPLLAQKQFTNGTPGDSVVMSLDKTKDSTKQFHTKTYNHIKDMISSRFGTVGSASSTNNNTNASNNGQPTNNQMSYNNNSGVSNGGHSINGGVNGNPNVNFNGQVNNATMYSGHNGMDMSLGLPTTSSAYGLHHHQNNTGNFVNGGNPNYYGVQPAQHSPNNPTGMNYRNDNANDRKNVNTSFRKAIQKSTEKSNLTEDSIQMRTISEVQAQNQVNANHVLHRPQQQQHQQYSPADHHHLNGGTGVPAVRAQKALDKLVEASKPYHPNPVAGHYQGQHVVNGDISSSRPHAQNPPPYPDKAPPPVPQPSSRMTDFSMKSPLGGLSPSKNTLSGYSSKHPDPVVQAWNQHALPDNDKPPPLPTSQKPTLDNNTSSLPSPLVSPVRENGDGSSGSAEVTSSTSLSESVSKSEKLKQMTTELHNLAMSVASEHHSSSSEGEIKGSQRVGSGQSHTTTDSGHGTVLLTKSPQHSGNTSEHAPLDGLIGQRHKFSDNIADSVSSGNDSEWVDIVEPEIRQILELERAAKTAAGKSNSSRSNPNGNSQSHTNQTLSSNLNTNEGSSRVVGDRSESPVAHSSRQLVLPSSPSHSPKLPKKYDLNIYNKKGNQDMLTEAAMGQDPSTSKTKSPRVPTSLLRSNSGSGQRSHPWSTRPRLADGKGKSSTVGRKELLMSQSKVGKLTRNAMSQILYSLHDENGDMTSTTTGLDLESMLDGPTENTSDDDDLSTTIDAHDIRRQLESLESMYTEVLKVLGQKKFPSGGRYPSSDLRNAKRRPYGSMSSLPSSVSSRPFRENKKKIDDKKKVKDIKSINRRFQRLESHVVTLARSVAHLSSEMRTQHLMVQEMESIRNELSQLRSQVMKAQNQSAAANAVAIANGQNFARGTSGGRQGGANVINSTDWTSFRNALPSLTNPCRVRKLTKFFGDEPPLIRIFLKKLGYEKYAIQFEQERIGIMELPYLTEERLQKMGIPMGPRLRILQEAHLCLKPGSHFPPDHPIHNGHGNTGNLSVYVV